MVEKAFFMMLKKNNKTLTPKIVLVCLKVLYAKKSTVLKKICLVYFFERDLKIVSYEKS